MTLRRTALSALQKTQNGLAGKKTKNSIHLYVILSQAARSRGKLIKSSMIYLDDASRTEAPMFYVHLFLGARNPFGTDALLVSTKSLDVHRRPTLANASTSFLHTADAIGARLQKIEDSFTTFYKPTPMKCWVILKFHGEKKTLDSRHLDLNEKFAQCLHLIITQVPWGAQISTARTCQESRTSLRWRTATALQ